MLVALTTSCGGDPVPTDPAIESSVLEGSAESGAMDGRIRKLVESVGLTDTQAEAIEALATRYAGEDREPGTAWYAAAELQTILDSEQIATIASRRAEASSRNRARGDRGWSAQGDGQRARGIAGSERRGPEGVTRGARWLGQLDLTEEQRARARAVFESRSEEFEALREQVLGGELTREQARERASVLREEVQAEIEMILTPEQRSRLAERRAEAEQKREQVRLRVEAAHQVMIEVLELGYPLRIGRYALRRDSGGAGQHAGGDGLVRDYEFLGPATVTLLTERRRHAPWGLDGGAAGRPGEILLNGEPLPGKISLLVRRGDRLSISTPGGGGWGAT